MSLDGSVYLTLFSILFTRYVLCVNHKYKLIKCTCYNANTQEAETG